MSCKKKPSEEKSNAYKTGLVIGTILIICLLLSFHLLLMPFLLKLALNGLGNEVTFVNCVLLWTLTLMIVQLFRRKRND